MEIQTFEDNQNRDRIMPAQRVNITFSYAERYRETSGSVKEIEVLRIGRSCERINPLYPQNQQYYSDVPSSEKILTGSQNMKKDMSLTETYYYRLFRNGNSCVSGDRIYQFLCLYWIAAMSCLVMSLMIGKISGGIFSLWLVCSFFCPLAGSTPFSVMCLFGKNCARKKFVWIYNTGMVLLTTGVIGAGILDTLEKSYVPEIGVVCIGGILSIAGIFLIIKSSLKNSGMTEENRMSDFRRGHSVS